MKVIDIISRDLFVLYSFEKWIMDYETFNYLAIWSVINLYKTTDNFPRVMRNDFFNLEVGEKVVFPDSHNHNKHIDVPLPTFDGIASN